MAAQNYLMVPAINTTLYFLPIPALITVLHFLLVFSLTTVLNCNLFCNCSILLPSAQNVRRHVNTARQSCRF